jgi:hypothetical protein
MKKKQEKSEKKHAKNPAKKQKKKKQVGLGIKIIESDDYKKTNPEKNRLTEKQLLRLLSQENKTDLEIERQFENLKQSYVVLLLIDPAKYSQTRRGLLRRFVQKEKLSGLYITVNQPVEKLLKEIEFDEIDISQVHFIDMISKTSGANTPRIKKVDYLESASDLTELMLLVDKIMPSLPSGKSFFVLDSISTLLVYNEVESVEKLAHALIGKLNSYNCKSILVMVKSQDKGGALQTISQFCDKVAEI